MESYNVEDVNINSLIPEKHSRMHKKIKDYYCNNEVGQTIVNAVTGNPYYNFKIGSPDEKLFWRVMIPVTNDKMTTTAKLFYESPEEYENHRNVEISWITKRNWHEKQQKDTVNDILSKQNIINEEQESVTVK